MFIDMFRSRPKGLVPNSNAYDLLAEAVRHLQWDEEEVPASLLYPSFTDRDSRDIVSEDDGALHGSNNLKESQGSSS